MPTINNSISALMHTWVKEQVESGQYADHSDYVYDLLRHDQECVKCLEAMQAAITKGLESGEATPLEMDNIIAEAKSFAHV